jgi:hypothetical protein
MPAFSIPLSGLTASSEALSAIANNLANLNTVGYKDTRVLFRDLFYQSLGTSGGGDPIQLGAGTAVNSMPSLFTQGSVNPSGVATDVAIMQDGFFIGHWQKVDSLRGAVVALGFQRLRDIVVSCSILKLTPIGATQINPVVFWEHSLGCALVCRHFARKIKFAHPEKAYLGGLLHDLGILVNLWILPKEFWSSDGAGTIPTSSTPRSRVERLGHDPLRQWQNPSRTLGPDA